MRVDRPSRTAQHNALFRALDARRVARARVADDQLAVHFLPLEFRALAELARIPLLLSLIERFIDHRWPGPRPGVVARTRLIDEAVSKTIGDIDQLVILGAGFDTRAYRLAGIDTVQVFEVDHPATQARKQRAVRRAIGRIPRHVSLIPVRFGEDDLIAALRASGFSVERRTLVVWEGVTNYLTAQTVDATFRSMAAVLRAGSELLFTYVDRGILDGTGSFEGADESSRHVRRVGEPYTFGFDPSAVAPFLSERGFDLAWDVSVPEAAVRDQNAEWAKGYDYYHVVRARRA
jgi:methyltransferase (TIGR00027 family)